MKKYIPILKKTQMFLGVSEEEIVSMLSCLGARLFYYKKDEYVLREGNIVSDVTVLLEGELHIQNEDYWGNRSILGHVEPGDMFGEAYISLDSGGLLNDVVTTKDSAVVFFDVKRVLTTCSSACRFHSMVVQNVFSAISKNFRRDQSEYSTIFSVASSDLGV